MKRLSTTNKRKFLSYLRELSYPHELKHGNIFIGHAVCDFVDNYCNVYFPGNPAKASLHFHDCANLLSKLIMVHNQIIGRHQPKLIEPTRKSYRQATAPCKAQIRRLSGREALARIGQSIKASLPYYFILQQFDQYIRWEDYIPLL